MRTRTAILSISLAALSGVACDTVPDDALERCEASQVVPGKVKTDILFVIDDSFSMAEEQDRVHVALSNFINTLTTSAIENDFQIGVTNTSVEDYLVQISTSTPPVEGATFNTYASGPNLGLGYPVPYPAGAIVSVDPTSLAFGNAATYGKYYYTPPAPSAGPGFDGNQILPWDSAILTTTFEANVLVGTHGAGREQPFRAVQLALTSQLERENMGFLRPGARLAIIFITDEDDCSGPADPLILSDTQCHDRDDRLLPVSDFAAFLEGPLGGEIRDVVVAAITGVTCSGGVCAPVGIHGCDIDSSHQAYLPPPRIMSLLSMLPPARTRLASICDDSFNTTLDAFATAMMSQTLPLDGAVADYRMLVAKVSRPGVGDIACRIQPADASPAATAAADAIYETPQWGHPASLTFQNACALLPGDSISVNIICAR